MKWFDKWFLKQSRKAWETVQDEPVLLPDTGFPLRKYNTTNGLNSSNTTFRTYNATGGMIVEVSHYNIMTDRTNTSLHIIPSEKDLGEAFAHIITYEALKQ